MGKLTGKVAWVTGAGSGIGEGAAVALAEEGATVILTGRRVDKLEAVSARIGQHAHVQAGDMTVVEDINRIVAWIGEKFGHLDIFVANAGANVPKRNWQELQPDGADLVIAANLNSAFYGAIAVLPMMRKQKDGVIIFTASMAGRFIGGLSGAAYTAAKHGVVAMSHSINMQECVNGIRSTALLPGEVATEILDKRPVPVSAEDRAKMAQSSDVGDLVRYIACLPAHVCINEVMITPTWNRGYVNALKMPRL